MTEEPVKPSRKKGRSPSYPGIDLEVAVRRADELYMRERQHGTPVNTILDHWGYNPKSGPGMVTLAALKKFGLLVDEGSGTGRTAQVSDLAMEIIMNPDPSEKREALQLAALSPKIHEELFAEYGSDLPSDSSLRYRLITQRGFTESGADEFIPQFRATIAYAGLDGRDVPPRVADDDRGNMSTAAVEPVVEVPGEAVRSAPASKPPVSEVPAPSGSMTIPIPLLGAPPVQVTAAFPLTEKDWGQFIRVLEAMKPGLVEPEEAGDN